MTNVKQVRVLLVEDNPGDTRYFQEILAQAGGSGFQTVTVECLEDGLACLATDEIDVVLLDLGLPDSSGLDTLLRAHARESKVPIIVLTGMADEELAEQAVREHAQDYLVKGRVNGELLVRSIRYAIERKRAEMKLRIREEEYRSLFEESKDVVFSLGVDGKLLDINPAGIELFGFSDQEQMRTADLALTIFQDPDEMDRLFEAVGQQGYVNEFELQLKRLSGEPIVAIVTCNAVKDQGGDIVSFRGIMHDITSHRKLEERLIQSHKMESIGRLAGGVAHDLNNFLTAGMGFIDLARVQSDDEAQRTDDLKGARTALEHAVDLTKQLLLFSRQEVPALTTVDLNDTVERLLQMLRRLIGEKYVIAANLGAEPSTVRADPGHLEQVLMNLVVNARDAMPAGGEILITTGNMNIEESSESAGPNARSGNYVVLIVEDSGIGMDPDTVTHIFEPFFSTKGIGKGTGLGLSVVFGVIAQHGGWIDVESEPGLGTKFHVFLPVAASDSKPRKHESEPLSIQGLGGNGEKVMIVEDEETVRRMANRTLSKHGYAVVTAGSAVEAQKVFEQEGDIQIVFCDVVLPGADGISLVHQLTSRAPDVKVLLTSGYSNEDQLAELRAQEYDFIAKPYALPRLLAALQTLINRD